MSIHAPAPPAANEEIVFQAPKVMFSKSTHYCPGCHHGTAHRLVAEVIEEMGLVEKTICASSIGCSVFIYNYLDIDTIESPHGRAPAVATGLKRARPDRIVFTYQGDGDLASIGLAEIMHAANRGERITVVFVNNTVYGMTGGQMAPTTLLGQKTTTSPNGRALESDGPPMRMAEIMGALGGVAYSTRVALDTVAHIRQAKKALRRAFEVQQMDIGLSFVEILATCPTNWRMDSLAANKRLTEEMIPAFPLGVYADRTDAASVVSEKPVEQKGKH